MFLFLLLVFARAIKMNLSVFMTVANMMMIVAWCVVSKLLSVFFSHCVAFPLGCGLWMCRAHVPRAVPLEDVVSSWEESIKHMKKCVINLIPSDKHGVAAGDCKLCAVSQARCMC
jgi:hypothetical protein